jgi:hypothetical protein
MASKKAIASISAIWAKVYGEAIDGDILPVWEEAFAFISDSELRRALDLTVKNWLKTTAPPPGVLYHAALSVRKNEWPDVSQAWKMAFKGVQECAYIGGVGALNGWGGVHRLPLPVRKTMEELGVMTFLTCGADDPALRAKWWDVYPEKLRKCVEAPFEEYEMLASQHGFRNKMLGAEKNPQITEGR